MGTKELIVDFLEENFDDFQTYLDINGIEPSEADVIIAELQDERE